MNSIQTKRLVLLPHSLELIEAWAKDRAHFEILLNTTPYGLQLEDWAQREMETAFPYWISKLNEFPSDEVWYAGWSIVLRDENVAIGAMGFAAPPDAEGVVTVGYCVDLRHRRSGMASEALDGLCAWAFAHDRVQAVRATIPAWNFPSVKVAEKCGFVHSGTTTEEGMELLVFLRKR